MMKVPTKVIKPIVIAISAILALAIVLTLVYFLAFRTLTIVSDSAFSLVLPKATMRSIRTTMAAKGIRVRTEVLTVNDFDDKDTFVSRIEKVKGSYVLLSPVSSAFAASKRINVSQILEDSTVIAMYGEKSSLFDCTLVSDEKSGWVEAAQKLSSDFEKTASNVSLIYENGKVPYIQDIKSFFPESRLSVFEDNGQSKLFASETLKKTDELSIVVSMCPYYSRLGDFFKNPGSLCWVVDYRFVPVVPKKQLYGMVVPDLSQALKEAIKTEKGSESEITVEYGYEEL